MVESETDPDEAPRVEVRIFEGGELVNTSHFGSMQAAEAFAEEWAEKVPGAHAEFEDLQRSHTLYELVEGDTALDEEYER